MAANKQRSPEEVLEDQRKEAAEAYGLKIAELAKKKDALEKDIRNMEEVIARHVKVRQEELNDLIAQAKQDREEADRIRQEAVNKTREASGKFLEAQKIHTRALDLHDSHKRMVEDHLDSVEGFRDEMAAKRSEMTDMHQRTTELLRDAQQKYMELDKREHGINARQMDLENSSQEITKRMAKMKAQEEEIRRQKAGLDEAQKEFFSQQRLLLDKNDDLLKLRDSLDKAAEFNRKQTASISSRLEDLKAKELKIQLDAQKIAEKQSILQAKEDRLNELKNTVDQLLVKHEEAAAGKT